MKITDFLPILGFLAFAARQWFENNSQAPPAGFKLEWLTWSGIALVVLGVAGRVPQMIRSAGARRMKYGSNTAAYIALVIGILTAANWMASRYPKRFDLSKDQHFSLSDQSLKILGALKEDVRIVYVQRAQTAANPTTTLLRQYQVASPRVHIEYLDPVKEPAQVRALDVQQLPTIVVAMGDRREKLLSDGEQNITTAILKVTRTVKKTVCFATGEGERDLDDPSERGYSGVKSAVERSQYAIKKVVLLQEQKVPDDCTMIVVAGPEKDLLPEAAGYVKAFVKAGGKAMIMVDPVTKTTSPNFESVFTEFGVKADNDVVVDASGVGQLFGTGPFMPIVTDYPFHEINKDLKGTMSAYDMARSITPVTPPPPGVAVQELAKTSRKSWGESDITLKEPIEFTDKDAAGPLNLAAAITVKSGAEPPPLTDPANPDAPKPDVSTKEGRVIAVGDSNFASNSLLTFQANQDLFMNMIAWLAQDSDLISIRPKDPEVHHLDLTMTEQRNILIFSLFLLPGFFILWGIVSWWRRRS